jgi:hypothetical protein
VVLRIIKVREIYKFYINYIVGCILRKIQTDNKYIASTMIFANLAKTDAIKP